MSRFMSEPGRFRTGVNYWSSRSATRMWRNWDPAEVEADFALFEEAGMEVVRVFPIWSEFQPIMAVRAAGSVGSAFCREYRFPGEEPIPDTPAGAAGVDEVMIERFEELCRIAERHHLELVVALLTGHMTFRLYVPPALDGLDLLSDPVALQWESRFLRYFVNRLKHCRAIATWELGNECNFLGVAASPEIAWCWTALMTSTIRAADPDRPVSSGMDSLQLYARSGGAMKSWLISDQAELCDLLSSHPYPLWPAHVNCDPVGTLRPVLYCTMENKLYAGIGGRDCFVEETGTWRRMFSDFAQLGRSLRVLLWNLWQTDGRGLLWWCAFDQDGCDFPPYSWDEAGVEHGCFSVARRYHPTGRVLADFAGFLKSLPFDRLPPAAADAVCILGRDQEHEKVALGSFILAAQAGLSLTFRFAEQQLPEAPVYLLPSMHRKGGLGNRNWRTLLERVEQGATLYVSMDSDANLTRMSEVFGAEVGKRWSEPGNAHYDFGDFTLDLPVPTRFELVGCGAEPWGENGGWVRKSGKGRIILLPFPLEMAALNRADAFRDSGNCDAWKVYREIGSEVLRHRLLRKHAPELFVTEHHFSDGRAAVVLSNISAEPIREMPEIAAGWRVADCRSEAPEAGFQDGTLSLPPDSGAILLLEPVSRG